MSVMIFLLGSHERGLEVPKHMKNSLVSAGGGGGVGVWEPGRKGAKEERVESRIIKVQELGEILQHF